MSIAIILTTLALGLWLAWHRWALPAINNWIRIDWSGPLTESWPNPFAVLGRDLGYAWKNYVDAISTFAKSFNNAFSQHREPSR